VEALARPPRPPPLRQPQRNPPRPRSKPAVVHPLSIWSSNRSTVPHPFRRFYREMGGKPTRYSTSGSIGRLWQTLLGRVRRSAAWLWSTLTARRRQAQARLRVVNCTRSTTLATQLETAATSAARNKGLLGRQSLGIGHGLWIVPCQSVHTATMRFAIDLVYLDRRLRVRKVGPLGHRAAGRDHCGHADPARGPTGV